jgi:guanylate kinase
MDNTTGRLILLSGPSCMGKGHLLKSLKKFHPELYSNLKRIVPYNSRMPRPGETDGVEFRFRNRDFIEDLASRKDMLVFDVRGDIHALNVKKVNKIISRHNALLVGNPFFTQAVRNHPRIPRGGALTVMLAPLSREEILFYKSMKHKIVSLEEFVIDLMRRKLLRRARRLKYNLSLRDLEDVETRAKAAITELCEAHRFDYVLVNHEGGDSEFWSSFYYPVGDPMRVLQAFADLLTGKTPAWSEKWELGLLP